MQGHVRAQSKSRPEKLMFDSHLKKSMNFDKVQGCFTPEQCGC